MQLNRFVTLSTSMLTNVVKFTFILLSTLIFTITVQADAPGTLDTSFGNNGKVITELGGKHFGYALALQSDGKMVVAGQSENNLAIARYNIDGSFDTSFGNNGLIITNYGNSSVGYGIVIQPDGKIVVAGESSNNFIVARYNTNGSLDASFDTDGKVTTDFGGSDSAQDIIIQPNGKILVIGESSANFAVARYNTNGSLDASFDTDGKVTTDFGDLDIAYGVALQPDNKIVMVGKGGSGSCECFVIARYNENGSLDTLFGNNGKVSPFIGWGSTYAFDVAIQDDQKIIVVGTTGLDTTDPRFALVRLNNDGSLDNTFNDSGVALTSFELNVSAQAVDIQPDGKIVVVGSASDWRSLYGLAMSRYNVDGSLDISFGTDGKLVTRGGYGYDVAVQTDDKIVVAGTKWEGYGNAGIALVRYDKHGNLDSSFGVNGKVNSDFGGSDDVDTAHSVAIQDDGKIVVVGSTLVQSSSSSYALTRYNTDGSLDTSFDSDGKVITAFGGFGGGGSAVAIQSDGKIVVAGTTSGYFSVIRYNSDGSFDNSFSDDGMVMTQVGDSSISQVNDMAIQPDGKIIVIGRESHYNFAIVRYNSDGSLDTSFYGSGVVVTDLGAYDTAYNLIIQPDGKILVAGTTDNGNMYSDFALVRYKNNGSLDRTFGVNGVVITDSNNWCESGYDVILQPDGKIVMVGEYPDIGTLLIRYHSTGSLDASFGNGGKVFTTGVYGYHLVSQSDGKIIVGGNIWNRSGSDFGLIRYNSNGSLDTSFGLNGITRTDFGQHDYSHGLAIQSDDKIVMVGESENKFAIARYIGINHPAFKMVPQNIAQIQAYSDTNLIRRNLNINNTGGGILTWSAVSSEPWIELGMNNGTVPSTIPITITLPVTTSGGVESTSLGEYTGLITFTGEGIVFNNPQVVKVKINVVQQVYHDYLPIILR